MIGALFKPWVQTPIAVVDVETTGTDLEEDHVVQLGIALFVDGACTQVLESIVCPPANVHIKPEASEIHGITDIDVGTYPKLADLLFQWRREYLIDAVAPLAYHEVFDRSMLRDANLWDSELPWIDPLPFVQMADAYVSGSGRYKLETACKRYGVKLDNAHSAGADARAAGELFFKLLDKGVLQDHWTLAELLSYQRKKAAKQQREYDRFKAQQDKAEHVQRAGQTRSHTCHWPGCELQVPPAVWGCKKHWFMLPKVLRNKVWRAYEPGQEETGRPSAEYLDAADEVQRWIAKH